MAKNFNDQAIQAIFKLILERKEGYQKASEYVEDDELSELFEGYVKQCEDFALELAPFDQTVENNILATPSSSNTKKVWADMKIALTSGDAKEILDSCISGEQSVLSKYTEIIEEERLNEDLYNVVDQQRGKIEEAFENIKIQLNAL